MFKIIKTNSTGILQTFGKFNRQLAPGIRFYIPYIQDIDIMNNKLKQDTLEFNVKTKDNVMLTLGLSVQHKIKPEDSAKAFYSMENPTEQMSSYIENNVRTKVSEMKFDEIFECENKIRSSVHEGLYEIMKENGITIKDTLINHITPPDEISYAMNKINATERLRIAAINEAEAEYIKSLRQAEADRDRKILQGQGISGQRLAILQGYKEGVNEMASQFGLSHAKIIEFVLRTQELDTMETIGKSNNTKTLFFNSKNDTQKESISTDYSNQNLQKLCVNDHLLSYANNDILTPLILAKEC